MEHTSQMATPFKGGSLRIDEELMARRLKNRERQRRYRAKKRLEADMRRSHMARQQATWPVEPQSHGIVNMSETSAASEQVEAQANSPTTTSFVARVYSGRKWKREARLRHPSETSESQPTMKPLPEVDANPEHSASSAIRRDWKADARNKIDSVACDSIQ